MDDPVVVNPTGGVPMNTAPMNGYVYPTNGYPTNGYPTNGNFGDAGGVAQMVMSRLDQLGQPAPQGQQRRVWPWILLTIGGTIAGALTGYMVGGLFCRVGRVVRGG